MADESGIGVLWRGPKNFFKKFSDERFAGWGFLLSVFGGWGVEFAYGIVAEPDLRSGLRTFCLLWFASAAAFFAGTSGGFLFGVPKAISNPANTPSAPTGLYKVNTNLEEISDWLTKIILGLGLVNLDKVIAFINSVGEEVATAIGQAKGAKAIAISAMIYGFVCGFIVVYIWTRTNLKLYLEASERPDLS